MTAQRMSAIFFGAILIAAYSVCTAQEPDAIAPDTFQQAFKLIGDGKPLAALAVLESSTDKQSPVHDILATVRSLVGDWHGAHRAADNFYPKPSKEAVAFSKPVMPVSALDTIVEEAQLHHIVIINEAHHVPQHRAFILQVLQKLRAQGFEYYAAETFGERMQDLAARGYAVRETGFYSNEPVFGDVIRKALKLGFKPVAYEAINVSPSGDSLDDINSRETQQCQNLVDRLFSKDPKAKVVIHVGFDHAMERARKVRAGREILWMAARLARETGIDPLTIDQTIHTERGEARLATSQWREANENGWLDQPIVLRRNDDTFDVSGHFKDLVDMQVLHPATKQIEGRPDWLAHAEGRLGVSIPDEIRAESARVLVQAFIETESEDAIPFDQLVLVPGEARPKLLLKPGKYRVVAQDEQGTEILRRALACE